MTEIQEPKQFDLLRLIIETNEGRYRLEGKGLFNEGIELKKISSPVLTKLG